MCIRDRAVTAWLWNLVAAEAAYGHISTWETGGVTDMSELFCVSDYCEYRNGGASSFNDDISAWNTTSVTTMRSMFREASSFDQPIGGWRVNKVRDM